MTYQMLSNYLPKQAEAQEIALQLQQWLPLTPNAQFNDQYLPDLKYKWSLNMESLSESFSAISTLWKKGQGKTLGLLLCESKQGEPHILLAFSGQLDGQWSRSGWAPPLFNPISFAHESFETQLQLYLLTHILNTHAQNESETTLKSTLKAQRKRKSSALTTKIHDAYHFTHPSGQTLRLSELWPNAPTGTGECCAPKLLNWANERALKPLGLVEFWWGTPKGSNKAGESKDPCTTRCIPLLPFMLGLCPAQPI